MSSNSGTGILGCGPLKYRCLKTLGSSNRKEFSLFTEEDRLTVPGFISLLLIIAASVFFFYHILFVSLERNTLVLNLVFCIPAAWLLTNFIKESIKILLLKIFAAIQLTFKVRQGALVSTGIVPCCKFKLAMLAGLPVILINALVVFLYVTLPNFQLLLAFNLVTFAVFSHADICLVVQSLSLKGKIHLSRFTISREVEVFGLVG